MSRYNPQMTAMIVDSDDYFAANNIDGGVRFGLKGVSVYIIKPEDANTARIKTCTTPKEVEAIFDEYQEGKHGNFVYDIKRG